MKVKKARRNNNYSVSRLIEARFDLLERVWGRLLSFLAKRGSLREKMEDLPRNRYNVETYKDGGFI